MTCRLEWMGLYYYLHEAYLRFSSRRSILAVLFDGALDELRGELHQIFPLRHRLGHVWDGVELPEDPQLLHVPDSPDQVFARAYLDIMSSTPTDAGGILPFLGMSDPSASIGRLRRAGLACHLRIPAVQGQISLPTLLCHTMAASRIFSKLWIRVWNRPCIVPGSLLALRQEIAVLLASKSGAGCRWLCHSSMAGCFCVSLPAPGSRSLNSKRR
jgi:hypothetical protein